MGKWAQYQKRGSALHVGNFSAPTAPDFTIDTITNSSVRVNRIASIPSGATGWGTQLQAQAGGAIIAASVELVGANVVQGGLAASTAYRIRTAWFRNGVPSSDWGPWMNFTTLP